MQEKKLTIFKVWHELAENPVINTKEFFVGVLALQIEDIRTFGNVNNEYFNTEKELLFIHTDDGEFIIEFSFEELVRIKNKQLKTKTILN